MLERLRRIDALRAERAGAAAIVAEVDRLVEEARAWLPVEGGGVGGAAETLERAGEAAERTRRAMIPM